MHRSVTELVTAAPLSYLVSAPENAPNKGPLPLLCFLHGYDEGAPMPIQKALTLHGPWSINASPLGLFNFIVVAPQLPQRGDLWHQHGDAVQKIVQQVQRQHGCAKHLYLTGFSFGGNGVFDLALAQPHLWRALWPVDPTRIPHHKPPQPVWLSSGQISRRSESGFVERLGLTALEEDEASHAGKHERIYLDQGQDHVGTANLAYGDDRIYRWLISHH